MILAAGGTLDAEAGTLALFVIVVLAVMTVLLVRNMSKRLKRLPKTFEQPPPPSEAPEQEKLD